MTVRFLMPPYNEFTDTIDTPTPYPLGTIAILHRPAGEVPVDLKSALSDLPLMVPAVVVQVDLNTTKTELSLTGDRAERQPAYLISSILPRARTVVEAIHRCPAGNGCLKQPYAKVWGLGSGVWPRVGTK